MFIFFHQIIDGKAMRFLTLTFQHDSGSYLIFQRNKAFTYLDVQLFMGIYKYDYDYLSTKCRWRLVLPLKNYLRVCTYNTLVRSECQTNKIMSKLFLF